jgi:hypothetical protein
MTFLPLCINITLMRRELSIHSVNCVNGMYYRGHPKVNDFFYSLIFTLNHRRPKMSKFDTSDKKFIETIFFKCHISLRCRQLGLLQS